MKFYSVEIPHLEHDLYVPFASFDKMSIEDRVLFNQLKDGSINKIKVLDYFRSYGYGDESNSKDFLIWEYDRYDFYHFIFDNPPAYLVSDKLKSIIENFTVLKSDKFYPVKFLYKKIKFDYSIFYQYHNILDLIDFQHTEFYLFDRDSKGKTLREYNGIQITKENFRSTMSDLFINKKIDFTYKKLVLNKFSDIYGPIADRLGYVMSERLKDQQAPLRAR